ncbi:MAG: YbhN family protein [Halanaeroarchaeum sp.]
MDVDRRAVALGFLGAALLVGGLVAVVGVGELTAALAAVDSRSMALLCLLGLGWLAAWGTTLRAVLGSLDGAVSRRLSFLLYASAAFANNVTPFGQAGGEPIAALLISRSTGSDYERGLAAIASVDALNFVPSIGMALVGLAVYATRFAVGERVRSVFVLVVGLAVAALLGAAILWRVRDRVVTATASTGDALLRAVDDRLPRVSLDGVRPGERIRGFFTAVSRVAADRRALAVAGTFSLLGWLALVATLWLTLGVLGAAVPVAVVLLVVPVSTVASIAPLPGGAGGVEAAIVLVLVPTTSVSPAVAGAAAIVYRVATYWVPTVLGAGAAAWLSGRTAA